ncbi:MAG TPA: putative PEP-binding protein, partial [Clostridia bacterium]|nr:putative PEP-binding protein [Clostridia bacterium]
AVLVDAYRGEIVVWPEAATRETFEEKLANWRSTQVLCQGLCKAPAHTADGRRVHVEANVGIAEDVQLAIENGADGVGLLRVEELYLTRDQPPTQEELFHELQAITAPLHDKPVTIRLLDVGSDKPLPFLRLPAEANRVLGLRGVRLLLEYPELTKIQLAAVLQLAQEQSIRVLIPMVTLEEDMEQFRELFEAVCADLGLRTSPLLGAMIETPAAALSLSDIARHADFLSVGTNDLTQYTLAADRDDPSVNRYYQDNHASVMRLLRLIINEAGNKPLTVCGELAGRDETLPDLMAMGYQSFSVSPSAIPTLKEVIRKTRLGPA